MNIVIAGGSGMLGRALTERLVGDGHQVTVLTRRPSGESGTARAREVEWTPDGTAGAWAQALDGADAVVNLTGAGIADKRWTASRKHELRESRVRSATSLVAAITQARARPAVFFQVSGVGYYGSDLSGRVCDESAGPGHDFLATLCVAWEGAAAPVTALGVRLVVARSGVVLAKRGGALDQMARPFKFFVGGPVASGRQYLSWIHVDDWVRMTIWALQTKDVAGALNVTAPNPVPNARFSAAIAHALHRPNLLPVPAFALRVLFGELADVVLVNGQRAVPARAEGLGFTFAHPTIDEAVRTCLT